MKIGFLKYGFILSVIFTAVQSGASEASCEALLTEKPTREQIHAYFANLEANYKDSLGNRGFMGAGMPNTAETSQIASEYGFVWWGLNIRIVKSLDHARKHRKLVTEYLKEEGKLFTDVITSALYVIGSEDESFLGVKKLKSGEGPFRQDVSKEAMTEILKRGAYQFLPDGSEQYIPAERIQRYVTPEKFNYNNVIHLPSSGGLNSLTQSGWVCFKQRGTHNFEEWRNTKEAQRLRNLAAKLLSQGYTVQFNHDHRAAMEMLAKQGRSYGKKDENGNRVRVVEFQTNRYSQKEDFNATLERLENGSGYSVGVYDPTGKLVAGEVGFKAGSHFAGDSVFYDHTLNKKEHGVDGVDLAKVATYAMMERLWQQGQPITDAEMISAYSNSLGAEYMEYGLFRQAIKIQGKTFDLNGTWDVRSDDERKKGIETLRDKRASALPSGFVSRFPVNTPEAVALAQSMRIERDILTIILANSEDSAMTALEAQPHALVLIGAYNFEKISRNQLRPPLKQILGATEKVRWLNGNEKQYKKFLTEESIRFFFGHGAESFDLTWTERAGLPAILAPAWKFKN